MRFGAACSIVRDLWFRGCFTIPGAHICLSASQACRNTIPRGSERDISGELCRCDHHIGWLRPLRAPAPAGVGSGRAPPGRVLLEAATRLRNEVIYAPVDISSDALETACDSISSLWPDVRLEPMVANYVTHPPRLERFHGTTLAIYIGSNIGNFAPEEARAILRNLRSELRAGDVFS